MINIQVYIIPDPFENYNKMFNELPQDIQNNINKYVRQIDRNIHLISYYMKKHLVGNKKIYLSEYGKPLADNINFNISHDYKCVVGVKHDKYPIGIDVIYKNRKINIEYLKKSFTNKEFNHIQNEKHLLLKYWCYKEAYLKMIGTGLSINPNRIEISNNKNEITVSLDNIVDKTVTLKLIEFSDYICSVSLNSNYSNLNMEYISDRNLFSNYII